MALLVDRGYGQTWFHQATLLDDKTCPLMYPNITKILHLLLLTSVTSSSVERANSSLKYIKNPLRSTMGEDRFNALLLMYVHRDIQIVINKIVDKFARKHPGKMMFIIHCLTNKHTFILCWGIYITMCMCII